jgi:glucan phosphoethanolaminetransferase (alkaline phosphatase superfamily)
MMMVIVTAADSDKDMVRGSMLWLLLLILLLMMVLMLWVSYPRWFRSITTVAAFCHRVVLITESRRLQR